MNKIIIDGKEYELSADLVEKIKAEAAIEEVVKPFMAAHPELVW